MSTPPERLGFKASRPADDSDATGDYPEAKQEIEEGLHKLETLLNSTVDKNFDKFEIYVLRNILSVPSDIADSVRLSHYEGVSHLPPQNVPTPEAIQLLRQKLAASRHVSRALTTEHSRNEVILGQLRDLVNTKAENGSAVNLSFMNSTVTQQPFSGQQPLTTNTKFALSQLPAMKTTLIELKAKLASLKEVHLSTDTAKDELREERRQYIEQRTKTHLERHGHSASAESGPLSGKQTDTAEVEALEKAAGMFNPP